MDQPNFELRVVMLMTQTGLPRPKVEEIVADEMKDERRLQVAKCQSEDALEAQTEKPLAGRERDTLLTIIAALCKDAGYDITKHAKTAGLIQSTAAGMGLSIGETTIEGHLKKIPNAIAGRMK